MYLAGLIVCFKSCMLSPDKPPPFFRFSDKIARSWKDWWTVNLVCIFKTVKTCIILYNSLSESVLSSMVFFQCQTSVIVTVEGIQRHDRLSTCFVEIAYNAPNLSINSQAGVYFRVTYSGMNNRIIISQSQVTRIKYFWDFHIFINLTIICPWFALDQRCISHDQCD